MAPENVDVIRAAHAAYTRGDIDSFLTLVQPDVEFKSLIVEADTAGTYRGHDGLRGWFEAINNAFDDPGSRLEDARDLGDDRVLAKVVAYGTAGGVRVEQTMWQGVILREGRIQSWTFCRSEAEALEAIGL